MTDSAERLTAEVLAAALVQVRSAYRSANWSLFGEKLREPIFEWTDKSSELGAWVSETRTLRMSAKLLELGWGSLVEILKHEMAHQFVDEVLGARDEAVHGPTFQRVCRERGIDGRARGAPPASGILEDDATGPLRRILHLLSLAGSDNPHEAENAAALARRLMLKYQLEHLVTADHRYTHRTCGRVLGRRFAYQRVIANILDEFFFVKVIITPAFDAKAMKSGSLLELSGTPENVEIASYVHDFLEAAGERAFRQHQRDRGTRSSKDRLDYLLGVMSGFRDKLTNEAKKAEKEGLVYLGDPELESYFRARHPYIRSVSGRGSVERDAFDAGKAAGTELVLSRGLRGNGSGAGPKLLPGKTS